MTGAPDGTAAMTESPEQKWPNAVSGDTDMPKWRRWDDALVPYRGYLLPISTLSVFGMVVWAWGGLGEVHPQSFVVPLGVGSHL